DRLVFQAGVAALPRRAAVGRDGDGAAAPHTPARRPQPAGAVDDEVVDDVARKRDAAARIAPGMRAVGGDVDLAAAGADVDGVGVGWIDDERADVGAVQIGAPPLRG